MTMKTKSEIVLLILFISIFMILSVVSQGRFLSFDNLQIMAFQLPELGMITLGMMVVILLAGINLSITATSALSGVITALFLTNIETGNICLLICGAIAVATMFGLLSGLLNGYIIAYIGVTPILATLGAKILFEGISLYLTKGGSISGYPKQFFIFGNGTIFQIPIPLIIFIVFLVITYFLLDRTPWGAKVYSIGSNPIAAKFSGIHVKRISLQVYIYSSLLASIASIIMISRYNSAKAALGQSYLLESIAAAVLGGTKITGGEGSVLGTLLAISIIQIISSGFNMLNVNRFITNAIMGLLLIFVLSVDYLWGMYGQRSSIKATNY